MLDWFKMEKLGMDCANHKVKLDNLDRFSIKVHLVSICETNSINLSNLSTLSSKYIIFNELKGGGQR